MTIWIGLSAIVFLVCLYALTFPLGGSHDHPDGSTHRFVFHEDVGYSTCHCGARLNPIEEVLESPHRHVWSYREDGMKTCRCGLLRHRVSTADYWPEGS